MVTYAKISLKKKGEQEKEEEEVEEEGSKRRRRGGDVYCRTFPVTVVSSNCSLEWMGGYTTITSLLHLCGQGRTTQQQKC